jgi:hypothetical protein
LFLEKFEQSPGTGMTDSPRSMNQRAVVQHVMPVKYSFPFSRLTKLSLCRRTESRGSFIDSLERVRCSEPSTTAGSFDDSLALILVHKQGSFE